MSGRDNAESDDSSKHSSHKAISYCLTLIYIVVPMQAACNMWHAATPRRWAHNKIKSILLQAAQAAASGWLCSTQIRADVVVVPLLLLLLLLFVAVVVVPWLPLTGTTQVDSEHEQRLSLSCRKSHREVVLDLDSEP